MADSVKIRITGDAKEFQSTLSGIGNTATSMFKGIMASQIVTKGVSMLTGGLRSAIDTGMQFEASMSQVAAISGATDAELQKLSDTARYYGETTQFTASQSAEALNYMALAGWDAQQSVDALGGVLDLAAASGMDLGAASDAVTDYLSAFSMEASQAGYMADMMAYAQSNSNTTASMLADAYGNCASSMHAAGQDIETTTAMLMALANQGIKGSEAGTQMAAVMRDLTQKMENGKISIGNTTVAVQKANGDFRDLNEILADVAAATDGMGTAEKSSALMETFTARSIKAINTLLNEGMGEVNKYEEALRESSGTAAEQAETMMDNLQGDILIFQSALEGLQITASESTNGIARNIVQEGTSLLEEITKAGKQGGLGGMADAAIAMVPKLLPKVVKGVEQLLGGLGKRLPGLVKNLISTIPDVLGSMGDLVPMLVESLTEATSAAVEGLIVNLPKIVSSLALGIGKTLLAAIKGIGNIGETLWNTLFGVKKKPEYESFGKLGTELTYDVSATANVDYTKAYEKVDAEYSTFIGTLDGYGLTTEQIAQILAFQGTPAQLQEWLDKKFPDLDAEAKAAIMAKFTAGTQEGGLSKLFEDMEEKFGLSAEDVAGIMVAATMGADLDAYLKEHFPDLDAAARKAIIAKFTGSTTTGFNALFTDLEGFGLSADDVAGLLIAHASGTDIDAYLDKHFPDLSASAKAVIKSRLGQDGEKLTAVFDSLSSLGLTADQIGDLLIAQANGTNLDSYLEKHFPDMPASVRQRILAELGAENDAMTNVVSSLSALGLTADQIGDLLVAKANGVDVAKYIDEHFPNLSAGAKQAIINELGDNNEIITGMFETLSALGLTAEQVGGLLVAKANGDDIDAYIAKVFPNLSASAKKAIVDTLGADNGKIDAVFDTLSSYGLTAAQVGALLVAKANGDDLDTYLSTHFPDLDAKARAAIINELGEENGNIDKIFTELSGLGLTTAQIGELLVAKANGEDIMDYVEDHFSGLPTEVMIAVKNALGGGNETLGSKLVTDLAGLGISNEDIVTLITAQKKGDTKTIEELLETKYANVKPEAIQALTNAWNNSDAQFDLSGASLGFAADLIVDMFTNGKKEDQEAVDAALETAKKIINDKRKQLYDYILANPDDPNAQSALEQVDAFDKAITEYANNYANASTEVCKEQGASLLELANNVQATVDFITESSRKVMSMQERVYRLGARGAKLNDADMKNALTYINAVYNEEAEAIAEARSEALGKALTQEDYDALEAEFVNGMAQAQAHSAARLATLLQGQFGDFGDLGFAAALTEAFGDISTAVDAADSAGKPLSKEDVAEILRKLGWTEDAIARGVAQIMGGAEELTSSNLSYAKLLESLSFGSLDEQLQGDNWNIDAFSRALYGVDFEVLGDALKTAVENGLIEGVKDGDGIDVNATLMQLLAQAFAGTVSEEPITANVPVAAEVTEVTVEDNAQAEIAEAVEEALTDPEPAEVAQDIAVTPGEVEADGPSYDELLATYNNDQAMAALAGKVWAGLNQAMAESVNSKRAINPLDWFQANVAMTDEEYAALADAMGISPEMLQSIIAERLGNLEALTPYGGGSILETMLPDLMEGPDQSVIDALNAAGGFAAQGYGEGMTGEDMSDYGSGLVDNALSAVETAQAQGSPAEAYKPAGGFAAQGYGEGMANEDVSEYANKLVTAAATAANIASADAAKPAGAKFASGLAAGILAGRSMVILAAKQVAQAALDATKDLLQIHSPSRVTEIFGELFDRGFARGIDAKAADVVRSAVNMAHNVVGAANLTPKMDLSGLTASMSGAVSHLADMESAREYVFRVNGVDLARVTAGDNNTALNGYTKRVKMGYGRG